MSKKALVSVWYDGYQLECCGSDFSVGEEVSWPVATPERRGEFGYDWYYEGGCGIGGDQVITGTIKRIVGMWSGEQEVEKSADAYGEDLYVEIEDPVLTAWHLPTPFGNLFLEVNGTRSKFQVEYLPLVRYSDKDPNWVLFDVAARYKLTPILDDRIEYPVTLNCYIDLKGKLSYQSPETGENKAALGLGSDSVRLSLASWDDDDAWYGSDGERVEINRGLNCIELGANNIKMLLAEKKKLALAFFCGAWKNLNHKTPDSENTEPRGNDDICQPDFATDSYLLPELFETS
jgi:hypothetical protein